MVTGLGITGSYLYLTAQGDDEGVMVIQNKATGTGGYLEIVSGDVQGTHTDIKMTPSNITIDGTVTANNTITGNLSGTVTGSLTGTMSGSVFGDDSTLLVDGINNRLVMSNNNTDDLPEGSNNKYFTNGRAIAMTIVFG